MTRYPALYIAAIILTGNVGFLVASEAHGLTTRSAAVLLQIFLWIASCAYLAAIIDAKNVEPDDLLLGTGVLFLVALPFARVVWVTQRGGSPTWSLAFAAAIALIIVSFYLTDEAPATEFLAAYWAVGTSLLQMGLTDRLPFARNAVAAMRSLHEALDLRILTTAVFVGVLFTRAVVQAVERGRPEIDDLPVLHVPPPDPDWHPLFAAVAAPFLYIGDAIFRALQAVVNVLWKLVATVIVFFYRIGEELVEIVVALLTERLVSAVARTVAILFLTFLSLLAITWAAPVVVRYIGAEKFFPELGILTIAVGLLLVVACLVTLIAWLFGQSKTAELWLRAPFVVSNLVAITFIAGLVLAVLARIDRLELTAFRSLGVFSWVLIAVIGFAIPGWAVKGSRKAPINPVRPRASSGTP